MVDLIKEKFKTGKYGIDDIPYSLWLGDSDDRVHKDIPNIDLEQEFNPEFKPDKSSYLVEEYIPYKKLSYESSKGVTIRATKIPIEWFDRYDFDKSCINNWYFDNNVNSDSIENVDKMSIREAFKKLDMTIFTNTKYYLDNREELAKDLGYIPDDKIISDSLEAVKPQLLYSIMCEIFGNNEYNNIDDPENKLYMVRNFRMLHMNGKFRIATCEISGNYLLFDYMYLKS